MKIQSRLFSKTEIQYGNKYIQIWPGATCKHVTMKHEQLKWEIRYIDIKILQHHTINYSF